MFAEEVCVLACNVLQPHARAASLHRCEHCILCMQVSRFGTTSTAHVPVTWSICACVRRAFVHRVYAPRSLCCHVRPALPQSVCIQTYRDSSVAQLRGPQNCCRCVMCVAWSLQQHGNTCSFRSTRLHLFKGHVFCPCHFNTTHCTALHTKLYVLAGIVLRHGPACHMFAYFPLCFEPKTHMCICMCLQALSSGMAQLSVVQPSDLSLCMQLADQLLGKTPGEHLAQIPSDLNLPRHIASAKQT